jgi:hypothetical protein
LERVAARSELGKRGGEVGNERPVFDRTHSSF